MNSVRKALLALAGFATLTLATALPASAQNATFDFSYSGPGVSASGVLDATLVSGTTDEYYITGISGERNGQAITGLVSPVPNPPGTTVYDPSSTAPNWIEYDDLVYYPGTPSLDNPGIYFTTSGDSYNIFSQSGDYIETDGTQWIATGSASANTTLNNFTITYTPEASSLVLLVPSALVLAGLALFARRRKAMQS